MSAIGKYRNGRGVEMEIIAYHTARNIIGTIYEAVIQDQLFGPRHYLITMDGLTDSGYVKIEDD